jgi:hypothetical protein
MATKHPNNGRPAVAHDFARADKCHGQAGQRKMQRLEDGRELRDDAPEHEDDQADRGGEHDARIEQCPPGGPLQFGGTGQVAPPAI